MTAIQPIVAALVLLATAVVDGSIVPQQNKAIARELTIVATVERIDRQARVVSIKNEDGVVQDVLVDQAVKTFDDLRVGDVVTMRYVESIVVQVKPGAKLQVETDTTAAARRGAGGANIEQQSRAVVTVERIDFDKLFVTYRTADGQKIVRAVEHRNLLDGIREGDRVEVTYTREKAVSIERRRR